MSARHSRRFIFTIPPPVSGLGVRSQILALPGMVVAEWYSDQFTGTTHGYILFKTTRAIPRKSVWIRYAHFVVATQAQTYGLLHRHLPELKSVGLVSQADSVYLNYRWRSACRITPEMWNDAYIKADAGLIPGLSLTVIYPPSKDSSSVSSTDVLPVSSEDTPAASIMSYFSNKNSSLSYFFL